MKKRNVKIIISIILFLVLLVTKYFGIDVNNVVNDYFEPKETIEIVKSYNVEDIPIYSGSSYVILDNNEPAFDEKYYKITSFELYSDLDDIGRAGVVFANVSKSTMPKEERGSIGQIKPTGWHTIKYDNIDGGYLYNRCHLIGYQLTGENTNERNLITCTRQMNVEGMLYFENKVSEYILKTNNHVLYRVTPVFEKENLLSNGVIIEVASIEDETIRINVFVYNVQTGINISYFDGTSNKVINN